MNIERLALPNGTLTRVGYVDVAIPGPFVGLERAQIDAVPWADARLCDGDNVRVGAAIWVAEIDGARIAFDPVQAADATLRASRESEAHHQDAIARTLAEAGFPRESIDLLVMTHIEGVGMVAWRDDEGRWSPFFPNARIALPAQNVAAYRALPAAQPGDIEREAWNALLAANIVDTYAHGDELRRGLFAEVTHGHGPGHAVLHFRDARGNAAVSFVGHLAVSPLHLATGECSALHEDPATAWAATRAVRDNGSTLVGPLWPSPGYGVWQDDAFVPGAR